MSLSLLTIEIRYEQDLVMTRQRTRQIAQLLGFDNQDQTRITTAVSEISRNAFQYAGGGKVIFSVDEQTGKLMGYSASVACPLRCQVFRITISDRGSGIADLAAILAGYYTSTTGRGLGIIGTQRLMDKFEIESSAQGTTVKIGKNLPEKAPVVTKAQIGKITDELIQRSPSNPFEEIQWQNQELLRALNALRQREEELTELNRELEDTNRGVVSLYAELDEKADSLQRANELKTRFLSNMSHEFRTPLNSINSLSGMLLERMDGDLTTEQEKQVTFIRKAAEGLTELVNDLLDLAKVEAGKIVVHPSPFEVGDLFGTLRGMLRPLLAHNSSIALIFEEAIDIPTLHTDEGKVAQILRNFISNSLKYTEQGEVRVSAVVVGDCVTFSVADTGIGVAPENQERIFEEYVQIDSPLQKRTKGTGLGLPLSRKLAELLGGRVWITSEFGAGSTVCASIPTIYPNLTLTTIAPQWQLDPQRAPVLVIEDQADILLAYQKYFEGSRYQMISVRTLKQAEQALGTFKPEAIILDILLEEENTWAFLAQKKESDSSAREIPILVNTVINNEQKAIALGADAFLIKPIDRFLLLNTLNKIIKGKRPQTLLLVDDDPVDRYLFKDLLSDFIHLIEAANGQEGIRLAQLELPTCIVLDLAIADESGVDILNQLKSDPATANIPVIMQTSQVLEDTQHQFLAAQTIAILSKERPSREVAQALLQEALLKAGIVFETLEKNHA